MKNLRRLPRSLWSTLDLFVAWLLWAPTRISLHMSIISGVRLGILPHRARKAFDRAMLRKHYRTAVEILILSNMTALPEEINTLTNQCLWRGYFARAALLARFLSPAKRLYLYRHLLQCDQMELADAVAAIDGRSISEPEAASIAVRRIMPDRRANAYASRIREMETLDHTKKRSMRLH